MLVSVTAAKCVGVEAVKVIVEADIASGIGVHIVGLPDVAVRESLLRTFTALEALGFRIPGKKIVINLAPADLRKNGSGYDLPIAVAIIAASSQRNLVRAGDFVMMGELGLNGELRAIPGGLPFAQMAGEEGFAGVILPVDCAREAAEFEVTKVYGAATLMDVVRILEGEEPCEDLLVAGSGVLLAKPVLYSGCDFEDIVGQEAAKRGAEIAAAGGHNLMLIGAPGAGKTSLAKAMAGILPPMTADEALMTSKIHSICGKSGVGSSYWRPFRSPHYSASLAAIIGGGGGDSILPGEVSLAHNGILFLDEFGQMPRSVIEALRGPLEDRCVTISRLRSKVDYPASFMMVAASNPCPCGYWGEGDRCNCTPSQRINYLSKLSGPILDRIDLHVRVRTVDPSQAMQRGGEEPSVKIRARVCRAREIQLERFKGTAIHTNAEMDNRMIEKFCTMSDECRNVMLRLMQSSGLSMRSYFRIIKVARTIADLDGSKDIAPEHLLEAASYRFLDKGLISSS